jgi:hypothetical protein
MMNSHYIYILTNMYIELKFNVLIRDIFYNGFFYGLL